MKYKELPEIVAEYIITRNLRELSQLTRYKIADEFGINKNYLSEKFKEGLQMTVLQFLDFEKMKRAECLLRTRPDLPVKKISRFLGIENLTQFRRKFKRFYGLKPGRYRALFKN